VITEESQVEQVEMLTQQLDGSIQLCDNAVYDSDCANLITPPSIYIQSPFLGGGDQDLSQGVSQPLAVVPAETLSPVEEVVATLPYCQDAEDLMAIAKHYSLEVMRDAIAQQPNPLRQQLREWFEQQPQEAVEENPTETLIKVWESCQDVEEFTEVCKFYEIPGKRSPTQKEELIEAAIIYSPLQVKQKLQRWWDSAVHQIRDFWQFLEQGEAALMQRG
jgi:hypothetical protein